MSLPILGLALATQTQQADRRTQPDAAGPAAQGQPTVVVTGRRAPAAPRRAPASIPAIPVPTDAWANGAVGLGDLLEQMLGVSVLEGNGPRDVGLSIRGSNARLGSGVRNIVVLEDGFPVTQANGIARLDAADPHAYGAIAMRRGPASARYGNYALEGVIDLRTRRGGDVNGVEGGAEGGSFGQFDAYAIAGGGGSGREAVAFASIARGEGATGHTDYRSETLDASASAALGAADRITVKLIWNASDDALPARLSFAQFLANPYQQGCERAAAASPGCATLGVFANGASGPRVQASAAEVDLGARDRRLVAGLRLDHSLGSDASWRIQGILDRRHVDQPSGALATIGTLASFLVETELEADGSLAGLAARGSAGLAYAYLDNAIGVYQRLPSFGGGGGLGALNQTVLGGVRNLRAHAHGELQLGRSWQLTVGIGAERSILDADQAGFSTAPGGQVPPPVSARRRFWNVAPEAELRWQAMPTLALHARAAAAYGVPQLGQLFVTAAGVPGDNVMLRTQRNRGVELGADLRSGEVLSAEATVFCEWLRDEQVTTSAGVNLLSFTTNAPRSRHRGVELGLRWRPAALAGAYLRAAYTYDDQHYTEFAERVTTAGMSRAFDRAGRRIPGVIPHFASIRVGYERARGAVAGLGGYADVTIRSAYPLDNANALDVPGVALLQLGIEYTPPRGAGRHIRPAVFAALRNAANRTYVGSALIVVDGLDPATGGAAGAAALARATGSIFAGQPRTLVVGLRARF